MLAADAVRDGEVAAGSMDDSGDRSRRQQGGDERSKEQEVDASRHCLDVKRAIHCRRRSDSDD